MAKPARPRVAPLVVLAPTEVTPTNYTGAPTYVAGTRSAATKRAASTSRQHAEQGLLGYVPAFSARTGPAWVELVWATVVAVLAGTVYALTAARDVVTGDTPELIAAARLAGVAHPPGYPLLAMAGHVFGWLPIGSYPFRTSMFSATCSAACVAMVYATVRRLTPYRPSAVGAALALAFTPVFWQWSLQFEVFGLANLLASVVVYLLVRWNQEPTRSRFLVGAAVVFGLAMTNQQTLLFLVPAVLFIVGRNRLQLMHHIRVLAYALVGLFAGLLPYLYIPIASARNPAVNWGDVDSLASFVALVTRKDYGSGLLLASGSAAGGNPFERLGYLGAGIGAIVGLLAILGLIYAYRVLRWYFWFAALGFLGTGPFFQFLANIKLDAQSRLFVLERFFLLPLVAVAPLSGLGISLIATVVSTRQSKWSVSRVAIIVTSVVLAITCLNAAVSYRRIDLSQDHVADRFARDLLTGLAPDTVLMMSGDESYAPTLYAHDAEHVRPDVVVVLSPGIGSKWYERELRRMGLAVPSAATVLALREANSSRPFAVIGALPDNSIAGKYYVYRDGLTYDVLPEATNKTLAQLSADNLTKLAKYRIPSSRTVKSRSLEGLIISHYSSIPYGVAQSYSDAKDDNDARLWYQKALAIDPHNPIIERALAALP